MNQWSHSWSSTSEEAFPASNNGNGGSDEAAEVEDVNDGTYTVCVHTLFQRKQRGKEEGQEGAGWRR